MTSTGKRKSDNTDEATKKIKIDEEVASSLEEGKQQVDDQTEQNTEEDSPTKKLNAANVLMAISDVAGIIKSGEANADGIKGMLFLTKFICIA